MAKSISIKGTERRCGGCALKVVELTSGELSPVRSSLALGESSRRIGQGTHSSKRSLMQRERARHAQNVLIPDTLTLG